jgi:hypothetical protein
MNSPIHEVLSEFIHGSSEDPSCRTVAVTTLVMSLWQLTGRGMSHQVPSLVQINAVGRDLDAIDDLARRLMEPHQCSKPKTYNEGLYMHGTPEQAPNAMKMALINMAKERKATFPDAKYRIQLEQQYFAALRTGFGTGAARNYSKAWHDDFHLLTDRSNELVLRLETEEDRVAFRHDVTKKSEKLRAPIGYGPGLRLVPKTTAVSGAIHADMWDADFAGAMVELGLPMLFLPTTVKAPPICNYSILEMVSSSFPAAFNSPVEEPTNFIPEPWFEAYKRELRKRLRHLPGDYEYCIQKLARQIIPVCHRIAIWCGKGATKEGVEALWLEMCMHTLRGLVMSIGGLAWHGLGFQTGSSRKDTLKVLRYLRDKGPMTKADLLRAAHLNKEQRDKLVNCLAAENLVRVNGKKLTATTYPEFIVALYGRKDLPEPVNLKSEVESSK